MKSSVLKLHQRIQWINSGASTGTTQEAKKCKIALLAIHSPNNTQETLEDSLISIRVSENPLYWLGDGDALKTTINRGTDLLIFLKS